MSLDNREIKCHPEEQSPKDPFLLLGFFASLRMTIIGLERRDVMTKNMVRARRFLRVLVVIGGLAVFLTGVALGIAIERWRAIEAMPTVDVSGMVVPIHHLGEGIYRFDVSARLGERWQESLVAFKKSHSHLLITAISAADETEFGVARSFLVVTEPLEETPAQE